MVEHNHIPEMVAEVVRGKALARIVEGATVTDESGNAVDLKNLRPDGSIGDPEAEAAGESPTDVVESVTEPVAEEPAPRAPTRTRRAPRSPDRRGSLTRSPVQ